MLGANTDADEGRGNPLQNRETLHGCDKRRRLCRYHRLLLGIEVGRDDEAVSETLEGLGEHGRPPAPALDPVKRPGIQRARPQCRDQQPRSGHGVLDRQVDADPPTGDIVCAASPMHSRPSAYQRRSRLTPTVSSLMSSSDSA
jgi:hypothetical protein